jgi:hypothetical protein
VQHNLGAVFTNLTEIAKRKINNEHGKQEKKRLITVKIVSEQL